MRYHKYLKIGSRTKKEPTQENDKTASYDDAH